MIELRFLERLRTDEEEGVAKRERILQYRLRVADPLYTGTNIVSSSDWVDVPLVKEEAK